MSIDMFLYRHKNSIAVLVGISTLLLSSAITYTGIISYITPPLPLKYLSARDLGRIGSVFLILTLLLALINYLFRSAKIKHPRYVIMYNNYRTYLHIAHTIFALTTLLIITLHFIYLAPLTNTFLLSAYLLLIYNTINGILLKVSKSKAKFYAYLLHQQWINVLFIAVYIILGHVTYGYWSFLSKIAFFA